MIYNHYISIIIPVYNEGKIIKENLLKVIKYMDSLNVNFEILTINDGSRDNTKEILSGFKHEKVKVINMEKNEGKGNAVREGIFHSKGDIIIYFDADLSYPLDTINRAIQEIDNFDIVIGSRRLPDSKIIVPPSKTRNFLGNSYSILIGLLLFKGFPDTQCGFKCFRSNVAKSIFKVQKIKRFGFDVEVIYIALKNKFKIKQIPVQLTSHNISKVNLIKDSIIMFFDLFRIKIYDKLGYYE